MAGAYLPKLDTPGRLVEMVDLSTSRLTAERCHALRDLGVEQVCVGLRYISAWNLHVEPYSIENLHIAANEFQLPVHAYAYYYLGGDVRSRALWSVEACLLEPRCKCLWHDWEDNGGAFPGIPNPQLLPFGHVLELMHTAMDAADDATDDLEFLIYTAGWWYPQATGNYTGFSGYGLADAHYIRPPGFTLAKPYGGWSECQIHQYQGSTDLVGLSVDRCLAKL